jgi:hypothetical protein
LFLNSFTFICYFKDLIPHHIQENIDDANERAKEIPQRPVPSPQTPERPEPVIYDANERAKEIPQRPEPSPQTPQRPNTSNL